MKKNLITVFLLFMVLSTGSFAQPKIATGANCSVAEKEKFVFLNNGVTVGMIINSVLKADKKRLTLTDAQLPKARQIISQATVAYNEGVKKMKPSGLNGKKLRVLAVAVETDKLHHYKSMLTPPQYALLLANHKKTYPESKE